MDRPKTALRSLTASRGGPLAGTVAVPGDASISQLALMLGALTTGRTSITGLRETADVLATARQIAALGANVDQDGRDWNVIGCGIGGLSLPRGPLDFGGSGVGAMLMAMGIVAGHDMTVAFTGDGSSRPHSTAPALRILAQMGVEIIGPPSDHGPLTLRGTCDLVPVDCALAVASDPVKAAILLAGLHAAGTTTVVVPEPTRDHGERMIRHLGGRVDIGTVGRSRRISVHGDATLVGRPIVVPGDPGAAAVLAAAALIVPGSAVTIPAVLVNPTRTAFFATALDMGADIAFLNLRDEGCEPVADIRVRHRPLRGVRVPSERVAGMIDEVPMLAVVAAFGDGPTRLHGLAARDGASNDRLAGIVAGLAANDVDARIEGDALVVAGSRTVEGGGTLAAGGDWRLALALLVLGLASDRPVTIDDTTMIATGFPEFRALLERVGVRFQA